MNSNKLLIYRQDHLQLMAPRWWLINSWHHCMHHRQSSQQQQGEISKCQLHLKNQVCLSNFLKAPQHYQYGLHFSSNLLPSNTEAKKIKNKKPNSIKDSSTKIKWLWNTLFQGILTFAPWGTIQNPVSASRPDLGATSPVSAISAGSAASVPCLKISSQHFTHMPFSLLKNVINLRQKKQNTEKHGRRKEKERQNEQQRRKKRTGF